MPAQAIWNPNQLSIEKLKITQFQQHLNQKFSLNISNYQQLHQFSINETEKFWQEMVVFCDVDFIQAATETVAYGKHMIDTDWFINGTLNYAQNILKYRSDKIAIEFENEQGVISSISYEQLYSKVAKLQFFLIQQGINKGDRVAGFLPNVIETIIAMLATTSLGAVWTSTSPDFGFEGVIDRFGQVEAKILFITDGYFYNGKT
ncbi:MAG: AMP-binding protein, partial [Alcanivoracaceae bacterium]|nr:AMP-binding protein [Alcanivoracaceae bacterium]